MKVYRMTRQHLTKGKEPRACLTAALHVTTEMNILGSDMTKNGSKGPHSLGANDEEIELAETIEGRAKVSFEQLAPQTSHIADGHSRNEMDVRRDLISEAAREEKVRVGDTDAGLAPKIQRIPTRPSVDLDVLGAVLNIHARHGVECPADDRARRYPRPELISRLDVAGESIEDEIELRCALHDALRELPDRLGVVTAVIVGVEREGSVQGDEVLDLEREVAIAALGHVAARRQHLAREGGGDVDVPGGDLFLEATPELGVGTRLGRLVVEADHKVADGRACVDAGVDGGGPTADFIGTFRGGVLDKGVSASPHY